MKLIKKILIATDFSAPAENAAQHAVQAAKLFKAKLLLLHVLPATPDAVISLEKTRGAIQQKLTVLQQELQQQGVEVEEPAVATGMPYEEILHYANVRDVNVVMLGSRSEAAERESNLGITAERLIRQTSKPIWVVKHASTPQIKKIMCAVDFSDTAAQALRNAVHLARGYGVELVVLNVVQSLSALYKGLLNVPSEEEQAYVQHQHEEFDKFLDNFDLHGVQITKEVRTGKPYREIIDCTAEMETDLLVLGTVGKDGLSRLLLGSVSERVIQEMPCSIVTVQSEDAVRLQFEQKFVDIETNLEQGQQLLAKGFAQEAAERFEYCLQQDALCEAALRGLAAANERLGKKNEAQRQRQQADEMRQRLWESQVESEIRNQHSAWATHRKL